jgi:hypothetical protein
MFKASKSTTVKYPIRTEFHITEEEYALIHFCEQGFLVTCIIIGLILFLVVVGTTIAATKWGDAEEREKMVVYFEEYEPNSEAVIWKKKPWAAFLYSFSLQVSFKHIFVKEYPVIKDANFRVFRGLNCIMTVWIILG